MNFSFSLVGSKRHPLSIALQFVPTCLCMACAQERMCPWRPEISDSQEMELQAMVSHPMWVLGTLDLLGTQTQGLCRKPAISHRLASSQCSTLSPLPGPAVPSLLHECAGPFPSLFGTESVFSPWRFFTRSSRCIPSAFLPRWSLRFVNPPVQSSLE